MKKKTGHSSRSTTVTTKKKNAGDTVTERTKRARQPNTWELRRSTSLCLCGCLQQPSGDAVYYSAACRKREQRRRDREAGIKPGKNKNLREYSWN